MSKFYRGSIHPDLLKECENLRLDIVNKGIISNPHMLTLPKLQKIILEKQKTQRRFLSPDQIRKIILG